MKTLQSHSISLHSHENTSNEVEKSILAAFKPIFRPKITISKTFTRRRLHTVLVISPIKGTEDLEDQYEDQRPQSLQTHSVPHRRGVVENQL